LSTHLTRSSIANKPEVDDNDYVTIEGAQLPLYHQEGGLFLQRHFWMPDFFKYR
jgi:hypothetical protein